MADPIARIETDYTIPPGETLLAFLENRQMAQADLARRMQRPLKTINEIVKGKAAITPETAIQLERVLGMPASFWNNREANYREDLARIAEREDLEGRVEWLRTFPMPEVQRLCAEAGVAVVFIPELPNTRASGAAKWLSPTKALIQLSLYGKSDDKLWFSFFHEAGHLLFHGRKLTFVHDENSKAENQFKDVKEEEADRFARDFLIPPAEYRRIAATHNTSTRIISKFAEEIGIAPGIVVGRLQHD